MRPGALEVRLKDQVTVLDRAAALTKPGGRIATSPARYCRRKTASRSESFVVRHPDFVIVPPSQTTTVLWDKARFWRRHAAIGGRTLMTPRAPAPMDFSCRC